MAVFESLINDIESRFGLGTNAAPFVRELLNFVVRSPGGVDGFLEKLKSAGLGKEVTSWFGHTDAPSLSAAQVEQALGSGSLIGIANRLGLRGTVATTAVGYTLPKLIGLLTPGGKVPGTLPEEVTRFLSATAAPREEVAPAPSRSLKTSRPA